MEKESFLFLGASNDDCEWMAGGLARILVKKGHRVTFACTQQGTTEEARKLYMALTEEAWGIIGVAEKIALPNCLRDSRDEEIVRMISEVIARVKPDACFIQPPDDYLPHHMRFARASFLALQEGGTARERFDVKEVYAMECPAACYTRVDFFVNVDDEIEDSFRVLAVYDKWSEGFGSGMVWSKRGLAMMRAAHKPLRCKYAEGFKIVRADERRISCLPDILQDKFAMYPHFRGYGPPVYAL